MEMAFPEERGLFHQLVLQAASENKTKIVDIVGEKQKILRGILDQALVHLVTCCYLDASKSYEEALNILKNDPYLDVYELSDRDVGVIKYALCFTYVFANHKTDVAKEWLKQLNETYRSFQELSEEVFCRNERKNTCTVSLMKGVFILSHSEEFGPVYWSGFDKIVVQPNMAFEIVRIHMEPYMKWYLEKGNNIANKSTLKLDAPEFIPKAVQNKSVNVEKKSFSSKQAQTTVSMRHQQIQTDSVKITHVQCQTKDSHSRDYYAVNQNMEKQRLLLTDIKTLQTYSINNLYSKVQENENSYKETIKKLEQAIGEKETTIKEKDILIEYQTKKMLNDSEHFEALQKVLKEINERDFQRYEKLQEQCNFMQETLNHLWEQYFNFQKCVIVTNESKCDLMIKSLREILPEASSTSTPQLDVIHRELNAWEAQKNMVVHSKQLLQDKQGMFFRKLMECKFVDLQTCLEPVAIVLNKMDIIHGSFALNFKNNYQNEASNISYWNKTRGLDKNTVQSNPTLNKPTILEQKNISPAGVARQRLFNSTDFTKPAEEFVVPDEETIKKEILKLSHSVKERGGPNYWGLIVYLKLRIPGETEECLAEMLEKVREMSGKLSGMSRDTIYAQVVDHLEMKKLQSQKRGWKVSNRKWNGDKQGNDCAICFESFDTSETKILPCRHKFHKNCIETWLTENNLCPICRMFIVSDVVYPPLKN